MLGVDALELRQREVDLAAHLEQCGWLLARERLGDAGDEGGVVGDVLAHAAITTRGHRAQAPVDVDEVDREAVDLELAKHGRHLARRVGGAAAVGLPHCLVDTCGPRLHLLQREGIVEAVHPREVLDGLEHLCSRSTDRLRGRLPRRQLRVLRFEFDKLAVERVVLLVRQRRLVVQVVALPRLVDGVDELAPASARLGRDAHDSACSTGASSRTNRPAIPSAA